MDATWVQFGSRCYHFVHGEEDTAKSYSLQDAKEMCKEYDLLTVESAEENEDIIKYSPFVWKGKINIWLGMNYDSDDDVFKWHDDSRLSYNNWEYSGSDDLSLMDTCVALNTSTGKWKNISCTDGTENGVVCKTGSFYYCEYGEWEDTDRHRDEGSSLRSSSVWC
ncbi:CD302 antigen isoform X2 [Xyrauchen texanus]|uniref:CD302 antigen isoform X2 n=1 Tax=Xyrauchen texanus TaxID=154827 RepID=UPI002242C583|nr:CD302 antigen isoform X2 [Xyrauchen texanus]